MDGTKAKLSQVIERFCRVGQLRDSLWGAYEL